MCSRWLPYFRILSISSTLIIPFGAAQAENGVDLFAKSGGLACWEKAFEQNPKPKLELKQYMCFHRNLVVYGLNANQMEGMGSFGHYKIKENTIQIIGFVGSDWVSALYGNMCQWKISKDGQVLSLERHVKDCDLAGAWGKVDKSIDDSDVIEE